LKSRQRRKRDDVNRRERAIFLCKSLRRILCRIGFLMLAGISSPSQLVCQGERTGVGLIVLTLAVKFDRLHNTPKGWMKSDTWEGRTSSTGTLVLYGVLGR